ncbi:MAG: hypothetical protein RL701_7570, partial [Pseudomonadota bacterium]
TNADAEMSATAASLRELRGLYRSGWLIRAHQLISNAYRLRCGWIGQRIDASCEHAREVDSARLPQRDQLREHFVTDVDVHLDHNDYATLAHAPSAYRNESGWRSLKPPLFSVAIFKYLSFWYSGAVKFTSSEMTVCATRGSLR